MKLGVWHDLREASRGETCTHVLHAGHARLLASSPSLTGGPCPSPRPRDLSSLGPECAAGGQESGVAMVVAVEGAAAVTRPVHRHYIVFDYAESPRQRRRRSVCLRKMRSCQVPSLAQAQAAAT